MAITAKLSQFRGSRFTTWAYKFVILEVSAKIGRHFWRRVQPVAWSGAVCWCRSHSQMICLACWTVGAQRSRAGMAR